MAVSYVWSTSQDNNKILRYIYKANETKDVEKS